MNHTHDNSETSTGRIIPLAARADLEELLDWELWRTFCDIYRHRWGVYPAPIIQRKWRQTVRGILTETMPARPKAKRHDFPSI